MMAAAGHDAVDESGDELGHLFEDIQDRDSEYFAGDDR